MVAIRELPYCKTCADAAKKNLYDSEKSVILTVPSDNHPTSLPPFLPSPLPPFLPPSLPPYSLTPLPPPKNYM